MAVTYSITAMKLQVHENSRSMGIPAFVLIMLCISLANGDLASDGRALQAFKSAVGGRMRWDSNRNPCTWRGVNCSNSRVVFLSLPAAELSGTIPPFTLGNLTELRILRLRLNALQGSIPADLTNCRELRTLYLQDNQFSGPLPASFFSSWPQLTRLNLANNNFTGSLPDSLNGLKRLGTLLVENNSLTGSLPSLEQNSLTQFNVSNNRFTGPVPESLKRFPPDSFGGNSLCNSPLNPCNNSNGEPPEGNNSGGKPNGRVGPIVGIVVGSGVLVGLMVGILVVVCKRGRRRDGEKSEKKGPRFSDVNKPSDDSFTREEYSISVQEPEKRSASMVFFPGEKEKENQKEEAQFGLEDLLRASAELLGRGSVGTAYRAVLETGMAVMVKRMKSGAIGHREFTRQIQLIGKIKHKNLVPLRAYYYSSEEKLLVYDYMPMGSLSALLHGNRGTGRSALNWLTRLHIALGAAMGIEHLHKQSSKISHGNIKSSNILLTNNYDGCVGDFGLVQIVSSSTAAATTTLGNKSLGYRAPEVTELSKVSQKADVYSFGVLILELLTGKAPTQASLSDDGVDLPRWVQSIVREEWTSEVFDMDLIKERGDCMDEEGMLQLLQVGMQCVALYPDQRPTMSQVVKMIQDLSPSSP